jgi:hypothetical protein
VLLHKVGTVLQEVLAWVAAKRLTHLPGLQLLQTDTVRRKELLGTAQGRGTPAEVHAAVDAVGTVGVAYQSHTGSNRPCMDKG